jgi:large subunit ribosomal protein L6
MSRVGSNPILIPAGTEIILEGDNVVVKGPKGQLEATLHRTVKLETEENQVLVKRKRDDRVSRSMHGLTRSILNNMVVGVSEGWTKNLEMVGVGYRVQGGNDQITLSVGYSHPVIIKAPEGIQFSASENTKISVSGIDRVLVGQVAANIKKVRPPEAYKGKGIRYAGEYVRKKPGKAGKAAK